LTAKLINLSAWPDNLVKSALRMAWRPGTSGAVVYVSDRWFDADQHMAGENELPVDDDVGWDGVCYYEERVLYVFLSQTVEFPLVWWVNTELPGSYQRGMVFYSPAEYFVYCLAHELSHIWQFDNRRKKRLGDGFRSADDETDADIYAILKLNEYRRKTTFRDYQEAA
jgi:hypothetical protein